MKKQHLKVIIIMTLLLSIALFFLLGFHQYLSFDYLKQQQHHFQTFYQTNNPFLTLGSYFGIYVLVTALSLPGATILTLAGGFLFGLWTGTLIVSFASSLGATIAFLMSRFVLHDIVQKKFGDKLEVINRGIEQEGIFYLITMRLIPAFPFFVINLVMGLTPIKTLHFYLVSQLAMLPGTIVFINAGTELSKLSSIKGILSPKLLLSFALL